MASDIIMVKDHSDSGIGNSLLSYGLLFSNCSKGFLLYDHAIDRIVHTMAFVTPVVEHWLEREILNGSTKNDRSVSDLHLAPQFVNDYTSHLNAYLLDNSG